MKVVCKPIEMIAWFEKNGEIHPIRFKVLENDQVKVIAIQRVQAVHLEKLAGNPMYVFDCQSHIDGLVKIYQLKYEVRTCKWFLFKI